MQAQNYTPLLWDPHIGDRDLDLVHKVNKNVPLYIAVEFIKHFTILLIKNGHLLSVYSVPIVKTFKELENELLPHLETSAGMD